MISSPRLTSLLLLLGSVLASFGQQKGRVLNQITDFPIEAVAVHTPDMQRATTTDRHGYFDLSVFHSTDTLSFRHTAFRTQSIHYAEFDSQGRQILLVPQIFLLNELVVVAPSIRQNADDLPNKINFLESAQVQSSTYQNSAEVLLTTGNVLVQKTQGGGGSPIIRGFEANRILLVIDGVRMNNAIYRSGHLQNSITVDPATLDQVDIIFGPTSLVFGSDALGGVIHYKTIAPKLASDEHLLTKVGGYTQYGTASNHFKQHLNLHLGSQRFGSYSAATLSRFGNIRMGKWRNPDTEDSYGLVPYYAQRVNGVDAVVANPDPTVQQPTGYDQLDLIQKFRFVASTNLDIEANVQYSTSSEIHRLDALLEDDGKGGLKYAEEGYGPQNRIFASASAWYKHANTLFTNVKTIVAYQRIDEDRFSRRFGRNDKYFQNEDVHVFSLNSDFVKVLQEENRINYGIELTHNRVISQAHYQNIATQEIIPGQTRYPDGQNLSYSLAAYTTYKWLIRPGIGFNTGLRFNYSRYQSDFTAEYPIALPQATVDIRDAAPTGNLGLVLSPIRGIRINLLASSGFRTPNVDDYGKVRAKGGEVLVPNSTLRSEYAYNLESTLEFDFTEKLSLGITGFQTWITNALVRQYWSIGGSDSLFYDGDWYRMVTNINADQAQIRGLSATLAGSWDWGQFSTLKVRSTLNYTWGRNPMKDEPLGHIPPLFGRTQIDYIDNHWTIGISAYYNGLKRLADMSPYDEDNSAFISQNVQGYPAWWTLNASVSYLFWGKVRTMVAVDNLFDAHYRPFASPVAAPGRNFVFGLYFDF